MKKRQGHDEHLNCGICVEPLAWESRSQDDPAVHAKCWDTAHQQPRGWRRSFLDARGALPHRAEGEKAHG